MLRTHYGRLIFKRTIPLLTKRNNKDVDKRERKGRQTQKVNWYWKVGIGRNMNHIWKCHVIIFEAMPSSSVVFYNFTVRHPNFSITHHCFVEVINILSLSQAVEGAVLESATDTS